MIAEVDSRPHLQRRLRRVRLEAAVLSMALLRDRLVTADLAKLLLRTDTGSTGAQDLMTASALADARSGAEATVDVAARLSDRRTLIEASGLFDAAWYLSVNGDVAQAGIDALDHFNQHGSLELRDPGPHFDGRSYLHINSDVAAACVEPFIHYLLYGSAEGREVFSRKDASDESCSELSAIELPVRSLSLGATEDADALRQDAWLADLLAEISDLTTYIHLSPALLACLPLPLVQRISTSACCALDYAVEACTPFSIAFSAATDAIRPGESRVVHIRLLERASLDVGGLIWPNYRIGKIADLESERRRLARALPLDLEVSPLLHLYRPSGRAEGWPAVAIDARAGALSDHDLARSTAQHLVLHHHILGDGSAVLAYLDRFDHRFGSDMARRYKAITGAYA